jgi:hypothetical protein
VAAGLAAPDADEGQVVLPGHSQSFGSGQTHAWALWRSNVMQTASEDFARAIFALLVPDAYRPVFEPIRLRWPIHRELPASFLAFTRIRRCRPDIGTPA